MITIQALKDLQDELDVECGIRIKFVLHARGVDIIGYDYAERLIARVELLKLGIPTEKIFHFSPVQPQLSRI